MFLPAGTEHPGGPHGSGVVERVFVHEGTITVGPASDPLTLGPGDYARYGADRPHVYRSADEESRGAVADVLASLQAVRSAMDAERMPGRADAQQAEVARERLALFEVSLRSLRGPEY